MPASKKSRNAQAKTPIVSLRLRPELVERAEALAEVLTDAGVLAAARASGEVDRSMVLRLAIERGLAQLEEEYGKRAADRGRRKARPLPE